MIQEALVIAPLVVTPQLLYPTAASGPGIIHLQSLLTVLVSRNTTVEARQRSTDARCNHWVTGFAVVDKNEHDTSES